MSEEKNSDDGIFCTLQGTENKEEIIVSLYELDNLISLRSRIASGDIKEIEKIVPNFVPTFPELIRLKVVEDQRRDKSTIAGCVSLKPKDPESTEINPLHKRTIIVETFLADVSSCLLIANADDIDEKVNEIQEKYSINSIRDYMTYLVYFVFNNTKTRTQFFYQFNNIAKVNPAFEEVFRKRWNLDPEIFYSEYELARKSLENKVERSRLEYNRIRNEMITWESETNYDNIPTTSLHLYQTHLEIRFNSVGDIYEIFNGLQLDDKVPFAQVGDFFKVNRLFRPPKKWANTFPNSDLLVMYVSNRNKDRLVVSSEEDVRTQIKEGAYSQVFIAINKIDPVTFVNSITMEIQTNVSDTVSEEEIIKSIFKVLNLNITNCSYQQKRVSFDYLLPSPGPLYIPLFNDMAMNNDLFRNILAIDESFQTTKVRGGIFGYLRLQNGYLEEDTDIEEGKDEKDEKEKKQDTRVRFWININSVTLAEINRDSNLFKKIGDKYISVRIANVADDATARYMRKIINKVLSYYYDNRDNLLEPYKLLFSNYKQLFIRVDERNRETKTEEEEEEEESEEDKDQSEDEYNEDKEEEKEEDEERVSRTKKDSKKDSKRSTKEPNKKARDYEMFPRRYRKFCGQMPTVLTSKQEEQDAKNEGIDIMYFPLYGESNPKAIVCKRKGFPYVGLKQNNMFASTKDKYPYLPCCYSEDQKNNPRSYRYQYENKDEDDVEINSSDKATRRRNDIYKSNKIMQRLARGVLPNFVTRFLLTLDINSWPLYPWGREKNDLPQWIREGSQQGPNSVLDSINRAILEYYNDLSKSDKKEAEIYRKFIVSRLAVLDKVFDGYETISYEKREKLLTDIRKELKTLVNYNLTAQNSYTKELGDLIAILDNNNQYLDPKMFWRVLESVFNIDIVLFQRTNEEQEGRLSEPYYLQEWLQHRATKDGKDRLTVMLFETIGGLFIIKNYPSVERIVNVIYKKSGREKTIKRGYFTYKEYGKLLSRIQTATEQIHNWNGHPGKKYSNPWNTIPDSQCADFYGKIRLWQFKKVIVVTEPLPPVDLVLKTPPICNWEPADEKEALSWMEIEKIKNIEPVIDDGLIVGYNGRKKDISLFVPIKSRSFSEKGSTIVSAPIGESSKMTVFNNRVKQAYYLTEYAIWMFSRWMNRNKTANITNITKELVGKFGNEGIIIDPSFIMPKKVTRRFDEQHPTLIKDNKLVLDNINLRNRLLQMILIRGTRKPDIVREYYKREYIPNYYKDITDFSDSSKQIVLYGVSMLLGWIGSKIPHYTLADRVKHPLETPEMIAEQKDLNQKTIIEPYWIRLSSLPEELGKIIWIAQQSENEANAIAVAEKWRTLDYNDRKTKEELDLDHLLLIYESPEKIQIVRYGEDAHLRVVLQYRAYGRIHTLALLPFTISNDAL